jgi:lipopolysaccharide/colanic/teichoic acid biosynthesis glycosyltransferase
MRLKRLIDVGLSGVALVVLSPLFLAIAIAVTVDSGFPVFFSQTRVGARFRPFRIWKFRTMLQGLGGPPITAAGDPRITRVGHFLRDSKLNELPQLWNVLKGDMSLVGPRPELPEFVELFHDRYEQLLTIRPGLTDLASIEFRDEERRLAQVASPLEVYRLHILPEKLGLADEYCAKRSFYLDMEILARTVRAVWQFHR